MRKIAFSLFAIYTICCSSAVPTSAQVATIPDSDRDVRETVSIGGQFNAVPLSSVNVYTVPNGRWFHLTDLILTNYGSTDPCDVTISGKTYEIRVAPSSTLVVNMLTGPVFKAGETLTLTNTWRLPGHGSGCEPIFTVMGYVTKRAQ